MSDRTLWFRDPECANVERAGGKGASLAAMTAGGLNVPPGFVVHADVLAAAVDVAVWVEAGVRYERPGLIGISHLLEHLSARGASSGGADEYRRRIG